MTGIIATYLFINVGSDYHMLNKIMIMIMITIEHLLFNLSIYQFREANVIFVPFTPHSIKETLVSIISRQLPPLNLTHHERGEV